MIYEAWKRGARLDGWSETFDMSIWQSAYEACGIDPDWYAHRERSKDELLPWAHIGQKLSRDFLERGYDDVFERINVAKPEPGVVAKLPVLRSGG